MVTICVQNTNTIKQVRNKHGLREAKYDSEKQY